MDDCVSSTSLSFSLCSSVNRYPDEPQRDISLPSLALESSPRPTSHQPSYRRQAFGNDAGARWSEKNVPSFPSQTGNGGNWIGMQLSWVVSDSTSVTRQTRSAKKERSSLPLTLSSLLYSGRKEVVNPLCISRLETLSGNSNIWSEWVA